ncbi:MAG: translation initiation factor IF-2 [Oligoflexia bacterium]|nr:translation initiation factor IF-2 [Oligoflexia bacterium]
MTENIKVFELAKQMGMETMRLMDKLREFKIPVKSHMAELNEDLLKQIQDRFEEEKQKLQATKKPAKTTRTKKAVASVETATPKVAKAATKATASDKKPTTKKASAASAKVSRTVIRRKAGVAEEAAEPVLEEKQVLAEQTQEPAKAEKPKPGTAQVISRIDLKTTTGKSIDERRPQGVEQQRKSSSEEEPNFDREEMGKLIKQEALLQAKKAAALLRETKVETFNAADFKKRELLFQPKKKKVLSGRAALKTQITQKSAQKRKIKVEGGIKVLDLAQNMAVKAEQLIKKLKALGTEADNNTFLDVETAQVIASEYSYEIENVELSEEQLIEQSKQKIVASDVKEVTRPPVVTIMGHVDHGKTSLLDAIRSANVAAGEAGGITQHIGAYSVELNGRKITFLDTPGHEAFTAMRARGAKVTDIVILVVAADDGIMPQTREAINHAKAAGVPIIVAINKMDVPGANPQKVLQTLTEFELVAEEWGGTTIVAKVSALKKQGIKELLEMILLQADILELKAKKDIPATGTVIEARLEKGRGAVATILVQQGYAKQGDIIVAGTFYGKIRSMLNDKGVQQKECLPGEPAEILGLNGVPNAGDTFAVVDSEATAREIIQKRIEKQKATSATTMKMTLEDLFQKVQKSEVKELPLIIKSDVQGSAEAIKEMLLKIESDKVKVKILSSSVGGISESDVLLASASKAVIIGFNVRPETGVAPIAEKEGVEIKTYSIIYELLDDVKKAMSGMLAPTFVEKALGRAEVRNVFNVSKVGTIAGCSVINGKVTRQALVRLLRDSKIIFEGKLASLKRFKDDAREVNEGYECGIGIENYNDVKVGDIIEAYTKEQVQTLLN